MYEEEYYFSSESESLVGALEIYIYPYLIA